MRTTTHGIASEVMYYRGLDLIKRGMAHRKELIKRSQKHQTKIAKAIKEAKKRT